MPLLTPLLKLGLVVARPRLLLLRSDIRKFLCENMARYRAAGVEPSVKMNGGQHRLQRIGQQRAFLTALRTVFPAAQLQMLTPAQPSSHSRKRSLTHQLCFQLRESSL